MKIKLNNSTQLDLDKLIESRLLVQANSGGGKSMTIRRIIEQAFGHVQIIVIDPEGEFGNMRAKYDFVYCGKEGDAPAEPRSAALLARRLLELKASAIIDLYEIPMERKKFVRLFLEALVNLPKELWHDCLIIVDEAHVFAPEKSESEALSAVINLASLGRKRGYCLIAATQRPAKLHKDVSAECNNKLIGRAVQDIDRKRSAEELGFSTRDEVLSLRDLEPGEFYAFGPAVSREVVKIKIGEVSVPPPKRGAAKKAPPKPSAKVKEILSSLSDLPAEAQKEGATVAELKKEITILKQKLGRNNEPSQNLKEKWYDLGHAAAMTNAKKEIEAMKKEANAEIQRLATSLSKIHKITSQHETTTVITGPEKIEFKAHPRMPRETLQKSPIRKELERPYTETLKEWNEEDGKNLPDGEKKVLIAAIQYRNQGITRNQLTTVTGYKRSTRDAYIARLLKREYVMFNGDRMYPTQEGDDALGDDIQPLPTGQGLRYHLMQTLPEGEKKVLSVLIIARIGGETGFIPRDYIEAETSFKRSTRDAYISRLINRQLVESSSAGVRAVDMLFTDL
jgi:hypothetical protein